MKKFTMYKPLASFSLMMLLVLWQLAAVQATIYDLPITGNDVVRCGAGELELEVQWSGDELDETKIRWYTVPFYGEPIKDEHGDPVSGLTFNTGYIEFTQTYFVDYVGADGCPLCDRLLIRAVVADDALPTQLIYPATAFCDNVDDDFSPTIVGVDVGEFSVQPQSGQENNLLVVNSTTGEFNPNGVTPGVYRIVYEPEALTGCTPSTATVDITITAAPEQPEISYAENTYCGDAGIISVNQTGASGGTYSATPSGLCLDENTGAINTGNCLEGTYEVTYFVPAAGGCSSVFDTFEITINTVSEGGTAIADADEISSGSSTTIRLTDYNGDIQWQSSTDNDTFTDIPDANASELNTGDLTETTYYRAVVTNGICASDNSSTATVTVSAASVAGIASADPETICTGSTTTLTLEEFTGAIQWQSNETGSFVDIPGADDAAYLTPALTNGGTVDEIISYRAVVTEGLSAPDISNVVDVTIRPNPQPGLAIGDNICSGNDGTVVVFDYLGDAVQWQSSSSDSGPFNDIQDATEDSYTASGLSSTTYYRAAISNSPCNVVHSDVVAIEVSPPSVAGTANATITSMCVGGTTELSLTGYTGDIFWEYQAPGSDVWVYSGGNPTFTSDVLDEVGTHKYRAKVTSGVCDESMSNTVDITVVPQPVWISYVAPEASITYGEEVSFSVAVEHGLGGTITWVRSTTPGGEGETVTSPDTPPAAGTYYYRPQFDAEGEFCSLDDGTEYTVEVTQKELTVINAVVTTKTYDGSTDAVITGAELSGLVLGDEAGTDVVLENHTAGIFDVETVGTHNVVTAPMTISGDKASNYTLTQPTLSGTITARELTVSGSFTADDKIYDGNTDATMSINSLTLVDVQSVGETPDDVDLNITKLDFSTANAGSGITVSLTTAELTGERAGNYTLSLDGSPTTTADITPLELTIGGTFTAQNKVYDGGVTATIDDNSLTLETKIGEDDVSLTDISLEFANANVADDIVVSITSASLSGDKKDNYSLSIDDSPTTTADITPLQLNIENTTITKEKVYDGNTTAAVTAGDLQNVVSPDVVTVSATATYDNANVGTEKTITVAYTISGAAAGNYTAPVDFTTDDGVITALQLTIADPTITKEKVYDGNTDAAVTPGAITNKIENDEVTVSATATYDDANVGTGKTITVVYTISGTAAGNYTKPVDFTVNDGVITKKELTITGAVAENKVYDGTDVATVDFQNANLQGIVNNDVVSLEIADYNTTFAQSDVGTDIAVTVTGVTITGTAADNYEVAQPVDLTANITVAPLTITANDYEKGYGTEYEFDGTEFTATGLVGTETITSATLTSDGAAASAATGTYTIEIEDAEADAETSLGNYDITYEAGIMTVYEIIVESTDGLERKGYNTLNDAYNAINNGTHKGDIVVTIYANTDEDVTATLNASGKGSAEYDSVKIKAHTNVSIEGNAEPLIIIGE